MGMVGGGRGAFIGSVHRMAARLDGEIDLVAIDKDMLCVIEVRSRGRTDFGHPLETVDARKRARLRRAAAAYLAKKGAKKGGENRPVRFDVVAIVGETIELRRGAFE